MLSYVVRMYKSGKWWIADIPEVGGGEGIATQGRTLDEAREMALDAIITVLSSRVKDGAPLDVQKGPFTTGPEWERIHVPLRAELALIVRQARLESGVTMQQAADAVGVPLGTYQRWEDPRRCNATMATVDKIARALGKRADLVFV